MKTKIEELIKKYEDLEEREHQKSYVCGSLEAGRFLATRDLCGNFIDDLKNLLVEIK